MFTVNVVLVCEENREFRFSRTYELSAIPQKGWELMVFTNMRGGHIGASVYCVRQFLDRNSLEVLGDASLRGLCYLHLNNMGWKLNVPESVFANDRAVKKMMEKIAAEGSIVHVKQSAL